jgi:hypothetical protein
MSGKSYLPAVCVIPFDFEVAKRKRIDLQINYMDEIYGFCGGSMGNPIED